MFITLYYLTGNYLTERMMHHNQFCSDSSHIIGVDNLFSFVKACIFSTSSVLPCISGKRIYKIIPGGMIIVRTNMKKLVNIFVMEPVR